MLEDMTMQADTEQNSTDDLIERIDALLAKLQEGRQAVDSKVASDIGEVMIKLGTYDSYLRRQMSEERGNKAKCDYLYQYQTEIHYDLDTLSIQSKKRREELDRIDNSIALWTERKSEVRMLMSDSGKDAQEALDYIKSCLELDEHYYQIYPITAKDKVVANIAWKYRNGIVYDRGETEEQSE